MTERARYRRKVTRHQVAKLGWSIRESRAISIFETGPLGEIKNRQWIHIIAGHPYDCRLPQGRNLWRANTGRTWEDDDLVFASHAGTALDAHNVRREFRRVLNTAGLSGADWTPRELRHSFVSLLSAAGVPLEQISRLVGHSGTTVTETVYRKEIRPVLLEGATIMDQLFPKT